MVLTVKLIYPVEIYLSLCLLALLFNEPPPQKNNCIKNINIIYIFLLGFSKHIFLKTLTKAIKRIDTINSVIKQNH